MLAVISPDWKVERQEDWDQISKLVSCHLFQMLLGARVLILSAGIKHEKSLATFKIISCKVSDIEFPLPVLPQPATEEDV